MTLPPPRPGHATYDIAVVCLGNICRSPMADVILTAKLARAGLAHRVTVSSSGTGDWHLGEPMDRRAAAVLAAHGYDPTVHRAEHFDADWFDRHDLVLAMDATNLRDIGALADETTDRRRIRMFREFDPASAGDDDRDVPDPWYGEESSFGDVIAMVERTTDALVAQLAVLL